MQKNVEEVRAENVVGAEIPVERKGEIGDRSKKLPRTERVGEECLNERLTVQRENMQRLILDDIG